MASDFNHIFASERVRAAKQGEHHLVEQFATGVEQTAKVRRVAFHLADGRALPSLRHDRYGIVATHSHHCYATHSVGCADSHNCIVVDCRHSFIFC